MMAAMRNTGWIRGCALACLAWLACGAAHASQDAEAEVRMLRLRDGSIQWATIAAHDPEGLAILRLDTGGRARLPWSYLHPEEERDLRTRFGYVDLTGDEVLVEALRLTTTDGMEVVGRIVDRTADAILLKTSTGTVPVPKARLAGPPTTVQVNALEIWTRNELYALQQATADLTTAEGCYDLARFCERILAFAQAAEHYQKARELDPSFKKDEIGIAIERATGKAARQDQVDWLAGVDDLVGRRRFDDAVARAEAFAQKFPDSPMLPDAKRKHDRAVKARERYLLDRIGQLWPVKAAQIARTKSLELNFEGALSYLDGQMSADVLAAVTKAAQAITKEATSDAVRRMWTQRRKERWNRASYGLGTWLLGKDAALKGEKKEEEKPPANEKEKERADLAKKLERFLQNQEMARKSKSTGEQKDERETSWKELPGIARAGWMLAYYAENSGDFEVMSKPLFSSCRECGGTGTRLISLSGANVSKEAVGKATTDQVIECPTCHGLGVVRRVSYR